MWDTDDDGDGVSDGIDLSPASVTKYFLASDTAAQSITDTFKFNISGSYNGYIYIDMHVQPEELTHLNYGATYMDWRYDNKGLIQDLDGSQDDIRLFPYLSVETDVAPAADLAKDYNVVVMKDTDGDGVREMMMPLSPVGSAPPERRPRSPSPSGLWAAMFAFTSAMPSGDAVFILLMTITSARRKFTSPG